MFICFIYIINTHCMGLTLCLNKKKYEEAENINEIIQILQDEQKDNEFKLSEANKADDINQTYIYLHLNSFLTELLGVIDINIEKINKSTKELDNIKTILRKYYTTKERNNKVEITELNQLLIPFNSSDKN